MRGSVPGLAAGAGDRSCPCATAAARVRTMASARVRPIEKMLPRRGGGGAPTPPAAAFPQREYPQGARVLRHALERLAEERTELVAHEGPPAGGHGDVLLALGRVADDAAVVADAVVVHPEYLPTLGVERAQPAPRVRHEDEVPAGR